ncbi:MAG: hypothetical protein ACRD0S_08880, partial [Acidimicrobiales bacterium]
MTERAIRVLQPGPAGTEHRLLPDPGGPAHVDGRARRERRRHNLRSGRPAHVGGRARRERGRHNLRSGRPAHV